MSLAFKILLSLLVFSFLFLMGFTTIMGLIYSFKHICKQCGTALVFGDNIYEDMIEHWYCPNEECPASELHLGK